MTTTTTKLVLLVDHDNLPSRSIGFRELLGEWLSYINGSSFSYVADLHVRVFGGWFREVHTTERRFEAAAYYQATCPAAFRHNGKIIRVTFEFADSVYIPGKQLVPITHTVVRRFGAVHHSPARASLDCEEENCELKDVRRWFWKRRACTSRSCPKSFSEAFERDEQKQVDTHIVTELLCFVGSDDAPDHVGVVSSDWDMIPALVAAGVLCQTRNTAITNIRVKGSQTYQDAKLRELGVGILESQLS